ncbi:MAG: hypothetical protein ACOYXA_15245 [Bacteroidota bacterium]
MIASNNLLLDCDPGIDTIPSAASDLYQRGKYFSTSATSVVYISLTEAFSEEAKQIVGKLNSFRALPENWDSYGAVPPSTATIEKAVRFVKRADRNLLPFYFAAPGPNGEVTVEFRRGSREAAVYFDSDGNTELVLSDKNKIEFEGSLEANYRALLNFINA